MTFRWHPELSYKEKLILSQQEIDNLSLLVEQGCQFIVSSKMFTLIQETSQIKNITNSYYGTGIRICSWDNNLCKDLKDIYIKFSFSNNFEHYKLNAIDRILKLKAFL